MSTEKSLRELTQNNYTRAAYHPSPNAWEDLVLYFLMLDRFSDGNEQGTSFLDNNGQPTAGGTTPKFQFATDAYQADRALWSANGKRWCGGTLQGLRSKLGYLKRMGIGAIWLSPIFTQRHGEETYHGYGVQNFLDVDPHFGTRQDLRDMVDEAHRFGIYVILDIILNHAGDVFGYNADRYPKTKDGFTFMDARWDGNPYQVQGYREKSGAPTLPFAPVDLAVHPSAWPHGALWPAELQDPTTFTQRGHIENMDYDTEFLEGDFFSFRDINHGYHDRDASGKRLEEHFHPSPALIYLCRVYQFWIEFADLDGYRVDTVKHMELGATRFFTSSIHEFAQSLGKENFYLIGEITFSRKEAFALVEKTGLDAALGLDDVARKLEEVPKGLSSPQDYFTLFRNSLEIGKESHTWFRNRVVTMFDDHDKVGRTKQRFCGDKDHGGHQRLRAALALNLLTLGIPCLYYGTEQSFDGKGDEDHLIRECMFGGAFGSLQSIGKHFFDESHEIYRFISELVSWRKQRIALRRGRQYLREISESGTAGSFGLPGRMNGPMRSIVSWSRIFNNQELLVAINTDPENERSAWVTLEASLHQSGQLRCLYSSDAAMVGTSALIGAANGVSLKLVVPAGGVVLYE